MSLRNKIIGGLAALVAPILINGCVGNYQSSTISRICDNPTLISRDNDFEIRKAYISLKDEKIYRRGLENYERARINSEIPIVEYSGNCKGTAEIKA